MTASPSRTPTTDAALASTFPLAAAAAARVGTTPIDAVVSWRFPPLPDAVAEAAHTTFGVTIISDDAAADPRDLPAFAALYAHTRAEQIVRALARRTNLVLPAASALVIGGGPVAEVIAAILSRGGTRVVRGITDPVARLRAHLAGVRTAVAPWPDADLVITTGEGLPRSLSEERSDERRAERALASRSVAQGPDVGRPRSLSEERSDERSDERRTERAQRVEVTKGLPASGVFIDASLDPEPTVATAAEAVRPFVTKTGAHAWRVEAPGIYESGDGASDRPTRIADALVALSLLRAAAEDATAADALLAELALA